MICAASTDHLALCFVLCADKVFGKGFHYSPASSSIVCITEVLVSIKKPGWAGRKDFSWTWTITITITLWGYNCGTTPGQSRSEKAEETVEKTDIPLWPIPCHLPAAISGNTVKSRETQVQFYTEQNTSMWISINNTADTGPDQKFPLYADPTLGLLLPLCRLAL